MHALHIIYASTSGHTEYVLQVLTDFLHQRSPDIGIELQRAEDATPEDLLKGTVLLLACGSWNTGSVEGQLSPYMHLFLKETAKEIDLKSKPVAVIGLGDSRYRYTAKATDHLEEFVTSHKGKLLLPSLRVINEPYGQEEAIQAWGESLSSRISTVRIA